MKCLLCGSNDQKIFAWVESKGFPLVYYQCQRCGLIFQSPEESRAADPDFYTHTYRELYQASEEPTEKDLMVQGQRADQLVNFLRSKTKFQPARVLDIGASAGMLLRAFQQAFNCDVVGVEPGEAYRKYAESRGLKMFPSLEDLIATQPEKFELVSLIHVLEHLSDPLETLQTIQRELMAKNGLLLVEVPNFNVHNSYELAHITCLTPHTLQEMVRQAGFQVISLTRSGIPRSKLLNLYLTLIGKPFPKGSPSPSIRPDRFVHLKRKIGFFYRRVAQKLFPHKAWLPLPHEKGR